MVATRAICPHGHKIACTLDSGRALGDAAVLIACSIVFSPLEVFFRLNGLLDLQTNAGGAMA